MVSEETKLFPAVTCPTRRWSRKSAGEGEPDSAYRADMELVVLLTVLPGGRCAVPGAPCQPASSSVPPQKQLYTLALKWAEFAPGWSLIWKNSPQSGDSQKTRMA